MHARLMPGQGMCYLRALLSVIIKGVPNFPVLGPGHRLLDELIIDGLMHEGPGSGCTALTLQVEHSRDWSWQMSRLVTS